MKFRHLFSSLACVTLLALVTSAAAQFAAPGRGGSTPPGANPSLAKIFGKHTAFSATAQMKVMDASGKETMSGPITYKLLEGSTYWGMDLSQMKSDQIPPQAVAGMKQMGMTEMVMVNKPDAKTTMLIYPGLNAYAEVPVPNEVPSKEKTDIKVEAMEEETVNGHKCHKNKVTVTQAGKSQLFYTWTAKDMDDFPIRVEFSDANTKVLMDYTDVKLEKPAAKNFEPPTGFTRYPNLQAMMQGEMMKRMGQPPAAK